MNTNPGSSVIKMSEKLQRMKNLEDYDAIVIHAGHIGISNAEKLDDIVKQYQTTVDTIRNRSQNSKILISSILPKKDNKLANTNIESLNKKLNSLCSENDLKFIDHTKNFKFNQTLADRRFFQDDDTLSRKGTAVLAKQIKLVLQTVLGNFHRASLSQTVGRRKTLQSRHQYHRQMWKNRTIPPWARYLPAWMPHAYY